MMILYEALKDFAGPAATIIASITVASVTTVFALKTAKTANDQAQIALDKVKIDVMKDRMAVLAATRSLMRLVVNSRPGPFADLAEAQRLHREIDDGRYLFSAQTNDYLRKIADACFEAMDFSTPIPGVPLNADELDEYMKRNKAKQYLIKEMNRIPKRLEEEISPTFLLKNFHLRANSDSPIATFAIEKSTLATIAICTLIGFVFLLFGAAVVGSHSKSDQPPHSPVCFSTSQVSIPICPPR